MSILKIILKKYITFIFTISFISFIQFGPWSQPTKLFGGLGIDGMWYHKIIIDDDYKPNDYHLFKSFPSYLLKYSFNIMGISKTVDNVIYSFNLLNYLSIIISGIVCYKISKLKNFTKNKCIAYMFLIFCSFMILRISGYDPVTPDYFAFLLSFCLLFFILNKNNFFTFLFLLFSFFTNPIICLIFFLILFFPTDIKYHTSYSLLNSRWIHIVLSVCFGTLIILWSVYMILPMHKAGMELTKWNIADTLDINVFPVSVALVSIVCGVLSYHVISNSFPYLNLRNLFLINIKWLLIFIGMMIVKSLIISNNSLPTDLDDLGHLMFMWPLWFCMKPLCGVSEHIQSFGTLIVLTLIYWKNIVIFAKNHLGLGGLIVLLMFILFLTKPEARHTLPFLPIIGYLVVSVIPESTKNRLFFLTVIILGLLLSKFYYPLHLASFDNNDFQSFPAQHYFMFFGFSVNYLNYFILSFCSIISFLTLYFFKKNEFRS